VVRSRLGEILDLSRLTKAASRLVDKEVTRATESGGHDCIGCQADQGGRVTVNTAPRLLL
jgi:hypothetical protein